MTTAPDAGHGASGLGALRANRNFRLLWIGQILSDLGTQIGTLAYPLLVLALTHSALVAGAVGTAAEASAFVVRLPAGALADRLDRRRTMMLVDAARTVALATLAVLVATGAVSWPIVMVVAIVDRAGDTLFTPSSIAALPLIVPDEHLEAGWAVSEGRQYAANLVGPPLGGFLYGIGRAVPFVADAVSYGVSVLTSRAITGDFATKPEHDRAPRPLGRVPRGPEAALARLVSPGRPDPGAADQLRLQRGDLHGHPRAAAQRCVCGRDRRRRGGDHGRRNRRSRARSPDSART